MQHLAAGPGGPALAAVTCFKEGARQPGHCSPQPVLH